MDKNDIYYHSYPLFYSERMDDMSSNSKIKRTHNIFGSPHQFTEVVDPRIDDTSSDVGVNFMKNILSEAPICTIIPGEPAYLPGMAGSKLGTTDKISVTRALASAYLNGSSSMSNIFGGYIENSTEDQLRLYDFKRSYYQYMQYVNILCRTGAMLLDIGDYELFGQGSNTKLREYDWRYYRLNLDNNEAVAEYNNKWNNASSKISEAASELYNSFLKSKDSIFSALGIFDNEDDAGNTYTNEYEMRNTYEEIDSVLTGDNFVQFYVDADVSSSDDMSNATSESMIKSSFDSGANFMKEISFISNSGGVTAADDIANFAANSAQALDDGITSILGSTGGPIGQMGTALSRLINLTANVVKGENIVFPEIYQSSSYTKGYSITIHLRSPYGSKLAYYLNIFVPMMHLIALALPKQATANSTASPFLVKAYVDGIFSCNLGIVSSLSISKSSDGWNSSGLPNEVDVTLNIADLYSSLSISPSTQPQLFVNNYSLIEFLATNCGLNLANQDTLAKKAEIIASSLKTSFTDIDNNIGSMINEYINDSWLKFTSLSR